MLSLICLFSTNFTTVYFYKKEKKKNLTNDMKQLRSLLFFARLRPTIKDLSFLS